MKRVRDTYSPRGYTIDLYCVYCFNESQAVADGPKAYHLAHKQARNNGWILHRDGTATCPKCRTPKSEIE